MAHRVHDFTLRHHVVARQLAHPPGMEPDDDDEDEDTTTSASPPTSTPRPPDFDFPGIGDDDEDEDEEDQDTSTTSINRQPTAGPIVIIPTAGDSITTEIDSPVVAPSPTTTPREPPTTIASSTIERIPNTQPVAASASVPGTTFVTSTRPLSSSALPSASSAAAESTDESNTGVGTIIGGIAGGIAAAVLLVFAITYIIRKKRNAQYEKEAFDAAQFRQSAVLIDDPPTHADVVARGFQPPMSQHHGGYPGSGPAVTYGNMPSEWEGQNAAGYGTAHSGWDDMSPTSSQPFVGSGMPPPAGFSQHSPMASPVSAHHSFGQAAYGQPSYPSMGVNPQVMDRAPSPGGHVAAYPAVGVSVTRRSSGHAETPATPGAPYAAYPGIDPNGSPRNSEYVDMDRASVTPFQAAQYKMISNELNAPVPRGLPSPIAEEHMQRMSPPAGIHNQSATSPFDDPTRPISETNPINDFPAPPPPVLHSENPGRRVDSTPPMLPEIHVESRIASMNANGGDSFPVTPSPMALGFDPSVVGQPSPMASSFIVGEGAPNTQGHDGQQTFPSSPSADSTFAHTTATVSNSASNNAPAPATTSGPQRRTTMYDPEDAYGGM